jgi:hypothetical protein
MNKDHKGRPLTPRRVETLHRSRTPMVPEPTMENLDPTSSTTGTTDAATNPEVRATLERTTTTGSVDQEERYIHLLARLTHQAPLQALIRLRYPAQRRLLQYVQHPSLLLLRHPLRSLRFALHQRFGILPPRLRIVESGSRAPAQD